MTKSLSTAAQSAIREAFHQRLTRFLKAEGLSGVKITEGLVVSLPETDVMIKVVVKKERVDVQEELAVIAEKARVKAEADAKKAKKRASDEAKRAKTTTPPLHPLAVEAVGLSDVDSATMSQIETMIARDMDTMGDTDDSELPGNEALDAISDLENDGDFDTLVAN